MEARSQSVAHPNENEFHFQLECLLMEADAACIFFKAVLIPCKREAGILAKTDRIDARVLRAFAEAVTSCNLHPPERWVSISGQAPTTSLRKSENKIKS